MANVGSKGIVRYVETLASDTIGSGDGTAWAVTSDAGTTFARAVNTARGLHVYGTSDTGSADRQEFTSDVALFTGQTGHSSVEVMLMLGTITNVAFNFGFNDAVTGANSIIPAKIVTDTITGQSANAFLGIIFDTGADNDELHCFWRESAVDTTTSIADLRMVGMAPTASKWLYLKVEMQDRGSGNGVRATFLAVDHKGRSVEKVFNTSVGRTRPFYYYLGVENRTSSARTAYIKLPCWEQTIETV